MIDLKEKNTLADEIEKTMTAQKRQQQLKAYDAKIDQLAEKIELTVQKQGQDYFMVEILTMFLDVSIKMKEVMEMMESMNSVMELFGDAVGFIDQSMQMQDDIMNQTTATKYNVFTKMAARRRNRQIIRNNVNRMTQMASNMLAKYQMAADMSSSLQKVAGKLRTTTQQMSKASAKAKSKGAAGGSTDQYSDASKYLAERRAQRGEAPAAAPSASAPVGGGLDVSGV